ncbi:MAG: MBL fold metallo-hydrolase [Treponema sp.]|jgi:glyoxylase-like metal-dependent hydrolase (beta-lactamase superfamily II)|nr:MBL fold metallo-hydrolase [Treponema sp.]
MKYGVITGLMFGAAVTVFGADPAVFSFKTGEFQIDMLVESRGPGRPSILLGLGGEQLEKYLPGGDFQSEVNVFLVRGRGHTVLVDTGFGQALFDGMKKLGVEPGAVDTVLITHMHGDHIGGLARDGRALFPRAKVYLAARERDYWLNSAGNAAARTALAPYGGRVETFQPGDLGGGAPELLPGIRAAAAFGHTPGHTVFLIESGAEKFLIWGDLMHVEKVQFPLPGVSVSYDTDPEAAAASRKQVLAWAAANRVPVGGMHLVYPAAGRVQTDGAGYRFVPME